MASMGRFRRFQHGEEQRVQRRRGQRPDRPGRQHGQAPGAPQADQAQQRTALQRQPACPIWDGGQQETGDGRCDVAEHQLVEVPAQGIEDERLGQEAENGCDGEWQNEHRPQARQKEERPVAGRKPGKSVGPSISGLCRGPTPRPGICVMRHVSRNR
jgi:hypothetical protein